MTAFTHLLVPIDFRAPADHALQYALELAATFHAKVTVIHVTDLPPSAFADKPQGRYWPADNLAKGVRSELDAELAKARERHEAVEGVIVSGQPADTILDVARKRGVDLIVMGTHARGGIARLVRGSVAEKIVRLSPVPVLSVSSSASP